MTQAYPLAWPEGWPRAAMLDRSSSYRFGRDLTLHKAVSGLYEELQRLGAKSVVVSTNVEPRLDGMPRAGQRAPEDPGAAVYFTYQDRPMVMAQDGFDRIEGNVRSLALAIEHMRGLERHGGGYMMERAFAGFARLPPPEGVAVPVNWREMLGPVPAGLSPAETLLIIEARYRAKAREAHADTGGDDSAMIRLNAAITEARKELKS